MFKDMEIQELKKEIHQLKFRENEGLEETEQLRFELEDILKVQIMIEKDGLDIEKVQKMLFAAEKEIILLKDEIDNRQFEYDKLVKEKNKEKKSLQSKLKRL